ncbi:phage filamentation protein Fil family protein [Edwardsiella tarda]|uniref:phage filamentation protein Fil family protein n=1 Tax=Edwardsiella tarda TaxID=636 RepID=UPI003306848C
MPSYLQPFKGEIMQIFVTFLKQQSPSPLSADAHGWLELPDGRRFQPCISEFRFNTQPQARRRRPWWSRLMGLRG